MDSIPPERLGDAKAQFGDRFIERPSSSFTFCVLALAGCGLSAQPQPERIPRQLLPTSLDGVSESPSPIADPSPSSAD